MSSISYGIVRQLHEIIDRMQHKGNLNANEDEIKFNLLHKNWSETESKIKFNYKIL